MKKLISSLILCCMQLGFTASAITYYLSSAGNDNNSGLSASTPWQSILKLNTIDLQPGDSVLFKGGESFTGSIYLDQNDSGSPAQPIFIGSYSAGKAIILAGNGFGIQAYNCAGLHISDLQITGSGVSTNTARGIDFYMDVSYDLPFIKIDSCQISGFRGYGIQIGSWNTSNGFTDVRVTHVNSCNNGRGGMTSFGYNTLFNHKNFYVGYSSFYDNKGLASETTSPTGNGIVLSGIENATIEYCEAYNNGELNGNSAGGPVGIWFYLVKNGIIQFCESHHNNSPSVDGGGFDLDGGSQNCIIQYCYRHDNDGPGYLMAEYGSGVPFTGNIIRYNISQNDARKGSAGAITLWGADNNNRILQSQVYNNTIYVNDQNLVSGTPAAVKLQGNNFNGVKLCNNIFYSTGNAKMLDADMNVDSTMLHFLSNNYYAVSGQLVFSWAWNNYNDLASWKAAAVTQERRGAQQYGLSLDALLAAAGSGGTIGLNQLQQMPTLLNGYKLQRGSVIPDAGINMNSMFGSDIGTRDFFGNASMQGATQDMGAHECNDCFEMLPEMLVSFNVRKLRSAIAVYWQVNEPALVEKFILEQSSTGSDFSQVRTIRGDGRKRDYAVEDIVSAGPEKYFRLLVVLKSGNRFYSKIIAIQDAGSADFDLKPVNQPGSTCGVMVTSNVKQQVTFLIFTLSGQLIAKEMRTVLEGVSYLSFNIHGNKGAYLLKAISASGKTKTVQLIL